MTTPDQIINILDSSQQHIVQHSLQIDDFSQIGTLIITFQLVLLCTLNHVALPQLHLFSLKSDKFFATVKAIINNQFNFMNAEYPNSIVVENAPDYIASTQAQIDQTNYARNGVQKVIVKCQLTNQLKKLFENQKKWPFNITFGHAQNNTKGKYSIFNFKLDAQPISSLRKEMIQITSQVLLNNYRSYKEGSFPIVYEKNKKNLKGRGTEYFDNLIKGLPPYKATDISGKHNQLFVCHDMKGGYVQDTDFDSPVQTQRTTSYRFHYFWQTSILNYFSHKTISVPPLHWRILCRKFKVKCLGTFIVQPQMIDQKFYLTQEFQLQLVYFAKKYQFDGYLINLQDTVSMVQYLQTWIEELRQRLHKQIPGSILTWYDSVSTQGQVQYQNQINNKNKVYYDLTDSFYTNYWWNDQQLKDDAKQFQSGKTVYVGNDVWGRGTFGGGEYDLYKAIDEIEKQKQQNFGIALFAPAYTYESGGENNMPQFMTNQDKLYRGVWYDEFMLNGWNKPYAQMEYEMRQLKQKGPWFGKSQSFLLEKYHLYDRIKLQYFYQFNSIYHASFTKSNYTIILEIEDKGQKKLLKKEKFQYINEEIHSKYVKKVSVFLKNQLIPKQASLTLTVYSTIQNLFEKERLIISYPQKDKDWIQEVPYSSLIFQQDYQTFFNLGQGEYFYLFGQRIYKGYDFMADFDMPHTASINDPLKTNIRIDDAYVGGSCLQVDQGQLKLFSVDIPEQDLDFPDTYRLKIILKEGNIKTLYLTQKNGLNLPFQKTSQTNRANGWKQVIYTLSKSNIKVAKEQFFRSTSAYVIGFFESKTLIGQIYLDPNPPQVVFNPKEGPKALLMVRQSFKTPVSSNKIYLSFELNIKPQDIKTIFDFSTRYLLKIDNQFVAFIYVFQKGEMFYGRLDQIQIDSSKKQINVQLFDLDSTIDEVEIIRQQKINLMDFKYAQLGHKISVKNF